MASVGAGEAWCSSTSPRWIEPFLLMSLRFLVLVVLWLFICCGSMSMFGVPARYLLEMQVRQCERKGSNSRTPVPGYVRLPAQTLGSKVHPYPFVQVDPQALAGIRIQKADSRPLLAGL